MEILRFDATVGRQVDLYASDFVVTHLAAVDGPARVAAFHLAPGGRVGRHPAAANQMLCVVGGEGWASSADDVRVPIGVGQAVLWSGGEAHAVGTDPGLTAIVVEGDSLQATAESAT